MPLQVPIPLSESSRPNPNRVGRFFISTELVRTHWRELAAMLFSRVVVVRCELLWAKQAFEYVAISELFEPLRESESPPEYLISFRKDGDAVTLAEVRRV